MQALGSKSQNALQLHFDTVLHKLETSLGGTRWQCDGVEGLDADLFDQEEEVRAGKTKGLKLRCIAPFRQMWSEG